MTRVSRACTCSHFAEVEDTGEIGAELRSLQIGTAPVSQTARIVALKTITYPEGYRHMRRKAGNENVVEFETSGKTLEMSDVHVFRTGSEANTRILRQGNRTFNVSHKTTCRQNAKVTLDAHVQHGPRQRMN